MKHLTIKTYLLVSFIILLLSISCNRTGNIANIDGEIVGSSDSIILVHYFDFVDSIKLEDNKYFNINTQIREPIWLKLQIGVHTCPIYLQPNLNIKIECDYNLTELKVKEEAKNSEILDYLFQQNALAKTSSCSKVSFMYQASYQDFTDSINELQEQLQVNFDAFVNDYGKKHRYFCDSEKDRLQILIASIKLQYSRFMRYNNTLSDEDIEEFFTFLNEIDINKPEYSQLHEFKDFADKYIDYKLSLETSKEDSEIKTESDYVQFIFDLIKTDFTDSKTIEFLYYNKLFEFLSYTGPDYVEDYLEEFNEMYSSEYHKTNIDYLHSKWQNLKKGLPAPDFIVKDIEGNEHSIDEFLGKLVVIDVWASWCGPCLQENPYFEDLKKEFTNKLVVFISISVDDNSENWIAELEKSKMTEIQWFAQGWNNDLCKNYNIKSIPRYIVIDQEGKIVSANAPRPSGDLKDLIEELIAE
ncbi:MAG: TlpA family protein disulfide reductase [Bacteroidales bacterium]|nr:TlpA family protein disulfide reductase [Bacteroidales bacterium]